MLNTECNCVPASGKHSINDYNNNDYNNALNYITDIDNNDQDNNDNALCYEKAATVNTSVGGALVFVLVFIFVWIKRSPSFEFMKAFEGSQCALGQVCACSCYGCYCAPIAGCSI